ncbi:MAG TPA: EAL domain-containing protein, partial [Euzebyales bacterium]|nr:EAL domain-containing protein [Euzebyales bacterium]
ARHDSMLTSDDRDDRADAASGGGSGLSRRVQLLFCLLTVVTAVIPMLLLPTTQLPAWPQQVVAALALTSLICWSVVIFRRGRVPLVVEGVVPVSLVVWGLVTNDIRAMFGLLFVPLFQRAVYGPARRVWPMTVLYYGAYLVVNTRRYGVDSLLEPRAVTNTLGVLFVAWVMYTLGRVLRLHEETAAGEAVIARAGARLMAAQSTEAVYDAVLDALDDLTGDLRTGICLWRIRGRWFEEVAVRGEDTFVRRITRVAAEDVPVEMLEQVIQGCEIFVDRRTVRALMDQLVPRQDGQPPDPDMEVLICPLRESDKAVGAVTIAAGHLPASLRQFAIQIVVQAGLVLERLTLHKVVRGVVDGSADTFVTVDAEGRMEFVSAAVRDMLGDEPDAMLGRAIADVVHPDDVAALRDLMTDHEALDGHPEPVACRLRHRNGAWRDAEISARRVNGSDGRPATLLNVRDVTDRKALEAEVAFRAYHDGLTGLANRTRFAERLEQALERARRTRAVFAVAFLDIDDFKTINDSMGHTAGDRLLEVVARRLNDQLRAHDVAARFGGDEFAVLIEQAGDARDAERVVRRLVEGVGEPLTLDASVVTPRASVGLVVVDDPAAVTPAEIMRDADIAMYAAKRGGKGRMELFQQSMRVALQERLRLRTALARALDRDEFSLEYQPVYDLSSGRLVGAEALLRWHHPDFGTVSPEQFISLAEDDGTIVAIGRWLVSEVCRQVRRWHDLSGSTDFVVCVNMSARNFQDSQLVKVIAEALETHGVPPAKLVVEITESTLIIDTEDAGRALRTLCDLGVRMAIDDFGSGYSSLSYLQRFPVDYLKIDRSFIAGIGREPGSEALAHAIVRLAGALGIVAVAEGIEHQEQAATLRRWGCEYGQGFLFAQPSPPDEIDVLVYGLGASEYLALPDEAASGDCPLLTEPALPEPASTASE